MTESTPQNPSLATAAQAEFCQGMLEHLRAGLPMGEGLASLAHHARSRRLRRVAVLLRDSVAARGLSLSDAMAATAAQGTSGPAFPESFVALIRVGERTGGLTDMLDLLVRQQSRAARLRAVVRTTLWIPLGAVWVGVAVLATALLAVVPVMLRLSAESGAELSALPVVLSRVMICYWYLFAAVAAACLAWQWHFLYRPNFDGKAWRVLRRVPPFSAYYRSLNAMAFLGTAGALLRSGVAVPEALGLAGPTLAGEQARREAKWAQEMIETGSSPTQAAWFFLFLPLEARELLQSLQSDTGPGRVMEDMADYYEQRLEGMEHGLLRALAPVFVLIIAWTVVVVVSLVLQMSVEPFGRAIK